MRNAVVLLFASVVAAQAPDLILINEKDAQMWRNDGTASFSTRFKLADGEGLTAGAMADFDRNGHWDIAVADGAADQVVVNGVTGEVAGSRPWSWVKILLLILVVVFLVYLANQ